MTISSTLSRWEYLGDNLTTEFTYNNKIFVNTELEVYSDSILQTLTTDYTVSGVGLSTGGTVTYVTAPASNVSIVIIRIVPDTQSTEYPTGGSLPSNIIEDDLDRRTILSQQQQDALDRSITAPAGETQVDMTLPVIATRASKYLGFDSNGSPVELDAPAGTTALSTYGTSLGVSADSTAAQDLLNLSTSVTTAGSSTVYTSTSAEPITSYVDGQVFGVDFHVTCGAAPTLSRDGLAAKALVWPDGTALVAGDITTGGKALVSYDGTSFQVLSTPKTLGTAASVNTGVADGNVPAMDATGYPAADGSQITNLAPLRGHIDGLILSNDGTDPAKDIGISAGEAADDGQAVNMVLASALIKKLDAAWAVGTNAGALDGTESVGGTPDADTWYHIYEIRRSDTGVVDILASESATAPTMPTNYDQKRRIGAVLFDATPDILAFLQDGDEFMWDVAPLDISLVATLDATARLDPISVPLGIEVEAKIRTSGSDGVVPWAILVSSPLVSDQAAAIDNATLFASAGYDANTLYVRVDTSSQVRSRASLSTIDSFKLRTIGWIDPRDRNA